MPLKILCTANFTNSESAAIERVAETLGVPTSQVVRKAVKFFCKKCVPTHKRARKAR